MEQLSSGLVGLFVGAVLGLALSVFFEDALKRAIAKSAKAVDVIVDPEPVSLPDDLAQLRSEIAVRQEALTATGRQAHWNGPTYAVAGFSIRRLGLDESPGVHLRLKSTDYFTFLATQQLDRELPDGATLRSKYVDPFAPMDVPEFMRASFGTYTVVVTADELTLFAKRSQDVGAFPGCWDVSANEALPRSPDSHVRTPSGLYDESVGMRVRRVPARDHGFTAGRTEDEGRCGQMGARRDGVRPFHGPSRREPLAASRSTRPLDAGGARRVPPCSGQAVRTRVRRAADGTGAPQAR